MRVDLSPAGRGEEKKSGVSGNKPRRALNGFPLQAASKRRIVAIIVAKTARKPLSCGQ
jgi:hypothetical protein